MEKSRRGSVRAIWLGPCVLSLMGNGVLRSMVVVTVIALELGCGAGSGGSGAGGSGGSGGATGTTSTITLDSKTICEQYCVAAIEAGCTDSSVSACAESCLHAYEIFPECADAFDHLYACYAEEVPVGGCNGQCPAQNQAVGDCL